MGVNYMEMTKSFKALELDPSNFGHVDHVGVAYEILKTHEFLEGVGIYSNSIREIAARAGAAKKFNVTITMVFLSLIAERMEMTDHTDFEEFIAKNADLLTTDLMAGWYSDHRIKGDLARKIFVMPDRAA